MPKSNTTTDTVAHSFTGRPHGQHRPAPERVALHVHEHVLLTSDGEDIEAERDAYASAYAGEHGVGDELDAQLRTWGWLYAELTYAELCEQEQGWPARHSPRATEVRAARHYCRRLTYLRRSKPFCGVDTLG